MCDELVEAAGDLDRTFAEHVGAFTGEHAAVPSGGGEAAEVRLQFGNEERRKRDGANARLGLGCAHEELTGVQLDLLLLHPDGAVEEVNVAALEAEKFAATEAEETREQDQASISGWRRIRERPHLFDARDGPLGDPFDSCALDGARVPDDQFVGHRGLEDRAQEPATLRDGVGRRVTTSVTDVVGGGRWIWARRKCFSRPRRREFGVTTMG